MERGRNEPVLPVVDVHQEEWEGQIFLALRVLHFPENPKYSRLPGAFERLRVIPREVELRIDAAPQGAALTIADRLIPVYQDGEWSGVPGLRLHALDGATTLHRPGTPGSITITGVTVEEIWSAFHGLAGAEISSPTWTSPRNLTLGEQNAPMIWSPSELRMVSCIARRAGLLVAMGGHSIDLWWNSPERISVEVFVSNLSPIGRLEMLAAMTSNELTPRLVPSSRSEDSYYHTYLEFEDRTCELDVRIQIMPPR